MVLKSQVQGWAQGFPRHCTAGGNDLLFSGTLKSNLSEGLECPKEWGAHNGATTPLHLVLRARGQE